MAPGEYFYGAIAKSNASKDAEFPPKIKCIICEVLKGPTAFSPNRLAHLKDQMTRKSSFNPIKKGYIPCVNCAPHREEEFRCLWCSKYKARDKFSKTQLKFYRDEPTCEKCMFAKQNVGVDEGNDEHESSSDSNPGEVNEVDDEDDDVSSLTSAIHTASVADSSTFPSYAGSSTMDGGVKLNSSTLSAANIHISNAASSPVRAKFDSNRYGGPSYRPKPAPSAAESLASSTGNGKFAKVRAVTRPTTKFPFLDEPNYESEEEARDVESSDSDSDTV